MKVVNLTSNEVLADQAQFAKTFLTRLKGLMFRKEIEPGECLILHPCNSIHTFFMRFPIDVLFVSKENKVVHAIENISPNAVSPIVRSAARVVELPVGTIWKTNTKVGDRLSIIL